MSEPFIGEIRAFPYGFAPRGWALCNGAILSIAQNQALYAILGTMYGGNGTTTFALPDLRGRAPVHPGNGITLAQASGEEAHTLTISEMPAHNHQAVGSTNSASTKVAAGNVWATTQSLLYSTTQGNQTMSHQALGNEGNSQPHENMQPYLVLSYCIAIRGIFPTRN